PERDEIIVGGADGVPKIYRVFRITARKIGDDSNLIKRLKPMSGRVFGVAVSSDGTRIAAVSSLNGKGELAVYSYEFDTKLPDDLKAISAKRVQQRKADEQKKLDEHRSKDITRIADVKLDASPLYALAFHPDNRVVAIAGGDGTIRLIATETGKPITTFAAAPVGETGKQTQPTPVGDLVWSDSPLIRKSALPKGTTVTALTTHPSAIDLKHPFDYVQLLVSATLNTGEIIDVTCNVQMQHDGAVVDVTKSGFVKPTADGQGKLLVKLGEQTVE
ncbi:MAG: hypothetical protein ABGZ24_14095, partial [Fuerstiella sp.]